MKYNHACSIAFSVVTAHPEGEDITQEKLVIAILSRLADLVKNNELLEAVGAPFDTYLEEN